MRPSMQAKIRGDTRALLDAQQATTHLLHPHTHAQHTRHAKQATTSYFI